MPYFICPNCKERSLDHDRRASLLDATAVGCSRCGFGFLFELMDDYYPAPTTGFVVCDRDLMGHDVQEALHLNGEESEVSPIATALEWGVRQLDRKLQMRTASGAQKVVKVDLFPGYDEDGGLLVALTPD